MIYYLKKLIRWFYISLKFPNAKCSFSAKISRDTVLNDGVVVLDGTSVASCEIGKYSYLGSGCVFSRTKIGSFCSIGSEVICGLAKHPIHYVSTYPGFYTNKASGAFWFGTEREFNDKANIIIGADVWIGTRVTIIDGIEIGVGAVIAAGAVVTKNIPPYAIVGGVPAKVIRYRFDEELINALLDSEWWNLSADILTEVAKEIDNPANFLEKITLYKSINN